MFCPKLQLTEQNKNIEFKQRQVARGIGVRDRGEAQGAGKARGAAWFFARAFRFLLALALVCGSLSGGRAQTLPESNRQLIASSGAPKHEMISLVVLSDTYVELTADSLSKKLDEIYPGKFWPPRQQANFVVNGPAPGQYLIKSTIPGASGLFMLLSVPGPYTDFSDFARFITDPALRRKAEAQHCWLSVDLVRKITSDEDAYRFIGAGLAKLAPADAAMLVKPDDNSVVLFDEEIRRRLAAGWVRP
jgi:hypothetical protein